jgi:hypothetical protein
MAALTSASAASTLFLMADALREDDLLGALEPSLAEEIRASVLDVDVSLIDEMRALTLRERIAWSHGRALALERLRENDAAH